MMLHHNFLKNRRPALYTLHVFDSKDELVIIRTPLSISAFLSAVQILQLSDGRFVSGVLIFLITMMEEPFFLTEPASPFA